MARETEQMDDVIDDIDFMDTGFSDTGSSRWLYMLAGAVIGMGLMYLMDPSDGGRRRTMLGDRMRGLGSRVSHPFSGGSTGVEDATRH